MTLAVLSDIHGNLPALDAVLADIAGREVDAILNLGDILSGPLWPVETADRLIALGLPTIAGNHERQVLTDPREGMNETDGFTADRLRPDQLAWMRGLPATLRLLPDVLLVHGTPADDNDFFLETLGSGGIRAATPGEVVERAGQADAALILCGHSHIPRAIALDDGRLVVNPGSVGLQAFEGHHPHTYAVENGSPHARYALVERGAVGWRAEFVAVTYDWESAAARADRNGRPDWAKGLRTGRA